MVEIKLKISNIPFQRKMSGSHSQSTAGYMLGMYDRIQFQTFCISTFPEP